VRPPEATRLLSYAFSAVTAAFLAALASLLAWQSVAVWRREGLGYLTGTRWFFRVPEFGAAPMVYGTLAVAVLALLLAAPVALGAAVFTAEYLAPRPRALVKSLVELLAGVPSVVYGLLGVLLLRDWVYRLLERFDVLSGDTLLTAGVLLAVMVLPTIMTLSDDALRAVPGVQREAARSLGMTRAEAILRVSLPAAAPGIVAALLLGLGRALGETIAVFLVVGRQDNQWPQRLASLRPLLDSGQTLTSKLGGSETHIAYGDPLHWAAMAGLGVILLALVGTVTLAAAWLARRGSAAHA
jgi:phosphate transport system permease protein